MALLPSNQACRQADRQTDGNDRKTKKGQTSIQNANNAIMEERKKERKMYIRLREGLLLLTAYLLTCQLLRKKV